MVITCRCLTAQLPQSLIMIYWLALLWLLSCAFVLNLARHSFATTMKINNVSVRSISEALGHASALTTEHYMKSLPNENSKVMPSNLLSF